MGEADKPGNRIDSFPFYTVNARILTSTISPAITGDIVRNERERIDESYL